MNTVIFSFQAAVVEPALPGYWLRPLEGEATAGRFGGGL
jgi:hypothetical protein